MADPVLPRLDRQQVDHLVRRTTWGATPALVAEVTRDPQAWLEAQLAPERLDDRECDALLSRFPTIGWSINKVRTTTPFFNWDTMIEVSRAALARYVWSRRQLLEVMCDLWSNHLNVACPSEKVWDNRQDYDTTVIRRHALGRFSDMLAASAVHPAMLRYLDNASSSGESPNENYARELMELHTVGRDAGYGEEGVRAVARLLTGATSNWTSGEYEFLPRSHDPGAVSVLGWSAPAHTAADGERYQKDFIRFLAMHPRTAALIARKLCVHLVADDPPQALVDAVAKTYLSTGSSIPAMLRQIFASAEFWSSRRRKTRRPLEALVASARAVGVRPGPSGLGGVEDLYRMSEELGHAPLGWQPPNGYPDVAAAWSSAGGTMRRWNQAITLVNGQRPRGAVVPAAADLLMAPAPTDVGTTIGALAERVLGRAPTRTERTALLALAARGAREPVDAAWQRASAPALVHTLLNSPAHMER